MTKDITTVDQYIAAAPAERQVILRTVRQTIKAVLPEAVEKNQLPNAHLSSGRNYRAFCLRQTASRLLSYAFCDHGLPRGSTTLQD